MISMTERQLIQTILTQVGRAVLGKDQVLAKVLLAIDVPIRYEEARRGVKHAVFGGRGGDSR